MIPPLTTAEAQELLPGWAHDSVLTLVPLVPGLPVYDRLFGPKYGSPRGTVVEVTEFYPLCRCCRDTKQIGVYVKLENGGECSGLASHWIPDMDTPEARAHVEAWKARICPKCGASKHVGPSESLCCCEGL